MGAQPRSSHSLCHRRKGKGKGRSSARRRSPAASRPAETLTLTEACASEERNEVGLLGYAGPVILFDRNARWTARSKPTDGIETLAPFSPQAGFGLKDVTDANEAGRGLGRAGRFSLKFGPAQFFDFFTIHSLLFFQKPIFVCFLLSNFGKI